MNQTNKMGVKDDQEKSVLLGLFGSILLIIGSGLLLKTLSTQRLIDKSETWPVTMGEVISSEFEYYPDTEWASSSYAPIIEYQYTVSTDIYTCTMRLSTVSRKTEAFRIQQAYAVGSQIKVHYDPERPQLCVSGYDMVPAGSWILSLGFIAVGLVLAGNAIISILRK